ncbi:AAA-domain-containing protein [Atractiella rhizophila]|nr:AAA-domain-containing protein [Atractiella rhizophila]
MDTPFFFQLFPTFQRSSDSFNQPDLVVHDEELWKKLVKRSKNARERTFLSLTFQSNSTFAPEEGFPKVICSAEYESGGSSYPLISEHFASSLKHTWPLSSPVKRHLIPVTAREVSLTTLNEVFLQLQPGHGVETPNSALVVENFYATFSSTVIRQHDVITLRVDQTDVVLRVLMTLPVTQGEIRDSYTRVYLTTKRAASPKPVFTQTEESHNLSINSEFLAASLSSHGDETLTSKCPPRSITAFPLPAFQSSKAVSNAAHDASKCFVRFTDLPLLGLRANDWAYVRHANDNEICCLVQVCLVEPWEEIKPLFSDRSLDTSLRVWFHISTFRKLRGESDATNCLISIQPIPKPDFPTASLVKLARIASPQSSNKKYQSEILASLRKYFEDERRRVCDGDLIPISIVGHGCEDDDKFILPFSTSIKTIDIWFRVVEIKADSPNQDAALTDFEQKLLSGRYGCYVDPNRSKMLQSGSEQVPPALQAPHTGPSLNEPTRRFLQLVEVCLTPQASAYQLHLNILLHGQKGCGSLEAIREAGHRFGLHLLVVNCHDLKAEADNKVEDFLRVEFDSALASAPCILVLDQLEALTSRAQIDESGQEPVLLSTLSENFDRLQQAAFPTFVVGTTVELDDLPLRIRGLFNFDLNFEVPTELERLHYISRQTANGSATAPEVGLKQIATQSAALNFDELDDILSRARQHSIKDALQLSSNQLPISDIVGAGLSSTKMHIKQALDASRSAYSQNIGAPSIPNVEWDDIGGLVEVKSQILETIQLPLDHPELFLDGLKKRSGILLYGPPGTGKTLLAKAVATSCSLNFFSVKGPELLNMYIGESEANVRRVFQRARDAEPCVIFFDELDSVAPKRGNQGDSGGVMDRIVSQLLAELDGMSSGKGGNIFVIGATNRPDLLDPALLRPGRFDRMLYLGVSQTHEAQLRILEALTRRFKLAEDVNLLLIAEKCPFNLTGADFYALCSDAMLQAMTRKAEAIERKVAILQQNDSNLTEYRYLSDIATDEEVAVYVSQADFESALGSLVPSVSEQEMRHYKIVQQKFSADPA